MKFLRFIFSFLYARNWYDGSRELSKHRIYLFGGLLVLLVLAILLVYLLHAPVVYTSSV
jgi:hypothetical protein